MPLLLPQLDSEDSSSFRNVTEYDLVKAHAFAPRLLQSWRSVDRAFWRKQAASLMFGGVMPLLGYAVLNWSVTLIIVCTTAELCVALLADWLKIVLAGDVVRREVERASEGDFVYARRARAASREIATYRTRLTTQDWCRARGHGLQQRRCHARIVDAAERLSRGHAVYRHRVHRLGEIPGGFRQIPFPRPPCSGLLVFRRWCVWPAPIGQVPADDVPNVHSPR
jgi:hypothetical protein